MANVHGIVSIRYEDALGVPASTSVAFRADDASTIGAALSAATALATLAHAISDDAILSADVTIFNPETLPITAGAETNEGVNIAMETSAPSRDWTLWVPAIKDSLFVGGKINIATGAIPAFAGELVTPTGSLVWETPYENGYTALESAAEAFRKLRGLTSKKTKSSNPV